MKNKKQIIIPLSLVFITISGITLNAIFDTSFSKKNNPTIERSNIESNIESNYKENDIINVKDLPKEDVIENSQINKSKDNKIKNNLIMREIVTQQLMTILKIAL